MRMLPLGEDLKKEAQELGVSSRVWPDREATAGGEVPEPALQARVLAARRERRDSRLWIIALISAIASVLSALAAWFAVLK